MSELNKIQIIVAVDTKGGIGKNGYIPWDLPEDREHFANVTTGSTLIMGRSTYNEIADIFPNNEVDVLPNRKSIVVSKTVTELRGAQVARSLREAVVMAETDKVFVIGGERLFIEALSWAEYVHLTVVPGDYNCDRHFPVDFLRRAYKPIGWNKDLKTCGVIVYSRNIR